MRSVLFFCCFLWFVGGVVFCFDFPSFGEIQAIRTAVHYCILSSCLFFYCLLVWLTGLVGLVGCLVVDGASRGVGTVGICDHGVLRKPLKDELGS